MDPDLNQPRHTNNVQKLDLRQLLTVCTDPKHKDYRMAWYEFERRYRPIILGRIRNCLTLWNKQNDRTIIQEIASDISMRLVKNNFRVLRNFRATRNEKQLIQFLNVMSRNTTYAYMIAYVKNKAIPLDEGLGTFRELMAENPRTAEDLVDLLVNELRANLSGTRKPDYHVERDIFVFLLRCLYGFKAKEVESIPLLGMNSHSVDNVVHRLSKATL